MKVEAEVKEMMRRLEPLVSQIPLYISYLKTDPRIKDLETRFVFDMLWATYLDHEVCDMYEKYDCNDDNIGSAMKKALKKVMNVKSLKDIL